MTYAVMSGHEQPDVEISIPKGRVIAGEAIGILVLDLWYPLLPGNVANASTFDFPVLYEVLEGAGRQILSADPALVDLVIEGGKKLERQGVRAIVGACGYFANYQQEAAAALGVPVFLSSLLQVPIIARGLNLGQKVGVICADAGALSASTLRACGISDPSSIAIAGAQDLPEFNNILYCRGHFNSAKLERELVGLAMRLVEDNSEVGAILAECSDMPPYSWSIQNAVRLPVFDYTTMINWVYNAVVRRPFAGFV